MCNCHSYNKDTGTEPEVILDPNKYFDWDLKARTVCVDACIAEQIKALWREKIWTGGCCCGHNKTNPNVVLKEGEDPKKAIKLLKRIDPEREWDVLQWQLIKCK